MPTKRNVYCAHAKENKDISIYVYELECFNLNLCERCNNDLKFQLSEQAALEAAE